MRCLCDLVGVVVVFRRRPGGPGTGPGWAKPGHRGEARRGDDAEVPMMLLPTNVPTTKTTANKGDYLVVVVVVRPRAARVSTPPLSLIHI